LAETFVDHSRFAGTCYRAAGWTPLGQTSGYGRNAGRYYYHGTPKTIYVYSMQRKTRELLSAPFLEPELNGGRQPMVDLNAMNFEQTNTPLPPRLTTGGWSTLPGGIHRL